MITGICRTSYVSVWEPKPDLSGNMKYSICLMIPKKDKQAIEDILEAIDVAATKGVEKGKFSKAAIKNIKRPLRDGDAEYDAGDRSIEYRGMWFFNCSSTRPIGIVDSHAKPILDQEDFYSGCWCRADINFFPYAAGGSKGVGVGLGNLMKIKDDNRLDGSQSAEDAFKAYKSTADNEEDDLADNDGLV